ncbi:MAG: methyltransferase domain-containing protein [Streptosporangiaceae bacterium]
MTTRRPDSFNEVAALYEKARPLYPQAVIDDLVALTGVQPGDRVLEIGCGTGQVTVPLARLGVRVTALEPGPDLAAIARLNLAAYPDAGVVERRFEDYELPQARFDLVVSATAFHWVDPAIRVTKAAAALKAGGHLAIIHTHWGVGTQRDAFSARSQSCYERWEPDALPGFVPPVIADLPATRPELADSPSFAAIEHRLYEQVNHYSTASYLDLLRTFSNIQGLDAAARDGLLACLGQLINGDFDGNLARSDTRELWLARAIGATA